MGATVVLPAAVQVHSRTGLILDPTVKACF
jgi:hypothetical protein